MEDRPESFLVATDCMQCILCGCVVRSSENIIHLLKRHPEAFRIALAEGVGSAEASRIIRTIHKNLHLD